MTLLYRGTNYNPANVHQDGAQRKGVVYRGVAYTPGSGHKIGLVRLYIAECDNKSLVLIERGLRPSFFFSARPANLVTDQVLT